VALREKTVKLLNETQTEQLKEIVVQLKTAREGKSLSIDEIAMYTCIRPVFLKALEEGRFEDLQEAVFVQGFVRRYGDIVGLNGTDLAHDFGKICFPPEVHDESKITAKVPSIHIPLFVPYALLIAVASFGLFYVLNPQRQAQSKTQNQNIESQATSQKEAIQTPKPTLPVASTPTPIASKIATAIPSPAASATASPTASPTVSPIISPIASATPSPTSSPIASATQSPTPSSEINKTPSPAVSPTVNSGSQQVAVTLELQGSSWVRVRADGKIVYEGTLNKGEKKTVNAAQKLTVLAGNAGVVLVSANNEQAKPIGGEGEVKTVTYTTSQPANPQQTP
jgi:cytoskeletal protein RodZ